MSEITVSVCMPAHNAEKTIVTAVDSALAQDVPLEVVIVDDAGTDGTGALSREKYGQDNRVRLLVNEMNLGASGSRNRAVREARGRYVAFLDSDDWWAEGKLKKQLTRLQKTKASLCCTGRELITPDGKKTGRVIGVPPKITYKKLLSSNYINCSSVLMERERALEFPMEHEECHEDYLTWLKVLRKYGPAAGIDEPLLCYRLTNAGKSGSKLHSAAMTYRTYRAAGFGPAKSAVCFAMYTVNGLLKYGKAAVKPFTKA